MLRITIIILTLVCYGCDQDDTQKVAVVKPAIDIADSAVVNWTQLAAYLPEVKGYQVQEATGENAHSGTSGSQYYTFARRQYKQNDKELIIEIIDYKKDQKTFKGLLNMYGFNAPVRNEQFETRLVETGMPQVKALETKYTENKDIRLTLAVANRFLIHISEPGGYDDQLPEQVIKAIPLQQILSL